MWLFFSSCVIQVNLLLELLVAALYRKVDISWSHVELSILFTSEWVTNLHILTHSPTAIVVPTLRVSTTKIVKRNFFMWLFFRSCVIQVNLLLELLVAVFAITSLSKQNSSGIISESRYQLVSCWNIDFVYISVSDKFA